MLIVLMGVTGSGKSTIGTLLAAQLGVVFADADDYHPAANKAKLADGTPLTDSDRQPWLERLNQLLREWNEAGEDGVMACSALKAQYRETLLHGLPPEAVALVLLEGSRELIADRLAHRREHFMNPALLDSQVATLEDPGETALHVSNDGTPEQTVDAILNHFGLSRAAQTDETRRA